MYQPFLSFLIIFSPLKLIPKSSAKKPKTSGQTCLTGGGGGGWFSKGPLCFNNLLTDKLLWNHFTILGHFYIFYFDNNNNNNNSGVMSQTQPLKNSFVLRKGEEGDFFIFYF